MSCPTPFAPELLSLLEKARLGSDGQPWRPVAHHGLDVAAASDRLLELHAGTPARLATRCGCVPEAFRRAVVFFLALHEIGEIARPFQVERPDLRASGERSA
jgi:hypothetical protein